MFGDYHADHDSVLFATNIARATIHKETILTCLESICDRERDIKCMVHCKSGGVGDS